MSAQIISILIFTVRDGLPYFWLSQRLAEGHRKGYWQFPGGKIDDSDAHTLMAAQRELLEETGLSIPAPRFQRLTSTDAIHPSRGAYTTHWYLVQLSDTEVPQRTEPLENTDWYLLTTAEVALRQCLPGTLLAMKAMAELFTRRSVC